jgi:hypothetical protein
MTWRNGIKNIHIFNRDQNRGGVTISYQLSNDPEGIFIGLAHCSPHDLYSKKEGAAIAKERLQSEECDFIPASTIRDNFEHHIPVFIPQRSFTFEISDLTEDFLRNLIIGYVGYHYKDIGFKLSTGEWSC